MSAAVLLHAVTVEKLFGAFGSFVFFMATEAVIVRVLQRTWAGNDDHHKAAELLMGLTHHTTVAVVWGRLWIWPSDAIADDLIFGYDPNVERFAITCAVLVVAATETDRTAIAVNAALGPVSVRKPNRISRWRLLRRW